MIKKPIINTLEKNSAVKIVSYKPEKNYIDIAIILNTKDDFQTTYKNLVDNLKPIENRIKINLILTEEKNKNEQKYWSEAYIFLSEYLAHQEYGKILTYLDDWAISNKVTNINVTMDDKFLYVDYFYENNHYYKIIAKDCNGGDNIE